MWYGWVLLCFWFEPFASTEPLYDADVVPPVVDFQLYIVPVEELRTVSAEYHCCLGNVWLWFANSPTALSLNTFITINNIIRLIIVVFCVTTYRWGVLQVSAIDIGGGASHITESKRRWCAYNISFTASDIPTITALLIGYSSSMLVAG